MAIKTILVPLDELPRCNLRVELAACIARQHGAHLVGLSPTGLFEMPAPHGASLGGATDYIQLSSNYFDRRAREIATEFEAEARKLGVASFEARVVEAEPLPATVMHAPGSDLIVVAQTDPGSVAPMAGDFPQQVVMHTGRPVLIVPFAGRFATMGSNVLVAWSATREASRAVSDALPFLERAGKVHVLCLASSEEESEVNRPQFDETVAGMRRHGIQATGSLEVTSLDVGNALLSRAADLGSDLIVMGCYGHSRLNELALGGATRTVLHSMTVPVLMSH
jgi:nucleotide-binding universal stress UspA family protein